MQWPVEENRVRFALAKSFRCVEVLDRSWSRGGVGFSDHGLDSGVSSPTAANLDPPKKYGLKRDCFSGYHVFVFPICISGCPSWTVAFVLPVFS